MKKKDIGAALRRGVIAGTIAGSLSGWASFAVRAAVVDTFDPPAAREPVVPALPPLPAHPSLAPLPNVRAVQAPGTVVLPPVRVTQAAPVTTTKQS